MKQIILTNDNLADEHICCAFSDKKCTEGYKAKKAWIEQQLGYGLVFRKMDARAKVFIEYIPSENAWAPIDAPNTLFIQCFWVSGKYKKQGYGKHLLADCIEAGESKGKSGITILASKKKQPFMADPKFLKLQGFTPCDEAPPYFQLWHKPLTNNAPVPSFTDSAKKGICPDNNGLSVFYSNGCPFTEYYVNTELKKIADDRAIPLSITRFETKAQARNHTVPFTIYSVFYKGKFVTHHILNEKNFDRFVKL